MSLLDAAKALRAAQRNYAADRSEGKAIDVALAASILDTAISRAELASLSCEPATPKADPVPELCTYIKESIRLCGHGYIHMTCGDCQRRD